MIKRILCIIQGLPLFYSSLALAAEKAPPITPVVSANEAMRILFGLVVVVVLILFLSWLLKRLHHPALKMGGSFEMVGSLSLGAKEKIILLKVGEQYLLLGLAQGSINLLHDFGQTPPPGFLEGANPPFSQLFKKVIGKSK